MQSHVVVKKSSRETNVSSSFNFVSGENPNLDTTYPAALVDTELRLQLSNGKVHVQPIVAEVPSLRSALAKTVP